MENNTKSLMDLYSAADIGNDYQHLITIDDAVKITYFKDNNKDNNKLVCNALVCPAYLRHTRTSRPRKHDRRIYNDYDNTVELGYLRQLDSKHVALVKHNHEEIIHDHIYSPFQSEDIIGIELKDVLKKVKKINVAKDELTKECWKIMCNELPVFQWQNPRTFTTKEHELLFYMSGKHAKYRNMGDEVKLNDYYRISKEDWRRTRYSSKLYVDSWNGNRLRTKRDDVYNGYKWKKGQRIGLLHVMSIALYTDFEELQLELKKSYRWSETSYFAQEFNTFNDEEVLYNLRIDEMEALERMSQFYHWNHTLNLTIRMFGDYIGNEVLYHGIDKKMILNQRNEIFYGPLSLTTKYRSACAFAGTGMILEFQSKYPNKRYCIAFDAQFISSYPEEKERLLGFMNPRINKIHSLVNDDDPNNIEWQLKIHLFVINLFKDGLYNYSDNLIKILKHYLDIKLLHYKFVENVRKFDHLQSFKNNYVNSYVSDLYYQKNGYIYTTSVLLVL